MRLTEETETLILKLREEVFLKVTLTRLKLIFFGYL
jgi:hypothetical protein